MRRPCWLGKAIVLVILAYMMLGGTRRTSTGIVPCMHHLLAQSTIRALGWIQWYEFTGTVVGAMWVEYCA